MSTFVVGIGVVSQIWWKLEVGGRVQTRSTIKWKERGRLWLRGFHCPTNCPAAGRQLAACGREVAQVEH